MIAADSPSADSCLEEREHLLFQLGRIQGAIAAVRVLCARKALIEAREILALFDNAAL